MIKTTIDYYMKCHTEEIWTLQENMNALGPRYTGNKAHQTYIAMIKDKLESYECPVHTDSYSFKRWEATSYSLSVLENDKRKDIPVLSYYPYSGQTPEEGVTSEIVFVKNSRDLKKAAGKIALMAISHPALPSGLIFHTRQKPKNFKKMISHPVVSTQLFASKLHLAEKYGVKGIICYLKNESSGLMKGQYLPFTMPSFQCPTLWVDANIGEKLKRLASRPHKATLTLTADTSEDSKSETLYTIIEGQNKHEAIIVNSHTDGPNAAEENGGIALLALTDYYRQLPIESRDKTLIVVFATGHFRMSEFGVSGRQATSRWLSDHPELWDGKEGHLKAVAGLTIEHLGVTDTIPYEFVYTSNDTMTELYQIATAGRQFHHPVLLKPSKLYFGEGEPLYKAGIPTISLVPAPLYLCAESENGFIDRLHPELMMEQIKSFGHLLNLLNGPYR